MNTWQVARNLDWPRFLGTFVFADVALLVIALWDLGRRSANLVAESPALENLRHLSVVAREELRDLLDDARRPSGL
ncbi:hypothetical protein ACIB24_22570 [Spongisporangium articulatum]|uniref:Uncharacterized protein n=1 Tax=Spongisporangium articulatum TaxID=3362603 RepID=A0ABW8AU22_9ACTN